MVKVVLLLDSQLGGEGETSELHGVWLGVGVAKGLPGLGKRPIRPEVCIKDNGFHIPGGAVCGYPSRWKRVKQ